MRSMPKKIKKAEKVETRMKQLVDALFVRNRDWYRRRRGEWKQFTMGWTGVVVYSGAYHVLVGWTDSGRRSHIWGMQMVLVILGIVLDSEKTRKYGIAALAALAIGALIQMWHSKNIIARTARMKGGKD